jgi:ParB-like chromosome segregation protein Spo0J
MAKLNVPGTAGFNAGKNYMARTVRIEDIVIDPEISQIFKIQDKTRDEIRAKIKKFGYDKSQPVVVWKGQNILVDGHTRLAAAKESGLEEIPTVEMEFEDREAALLYTFERQVLRRNLTGPEILTAARTIHGRKEKDGRGRAAELLAERLGISASTVYQAQAILREAPEADVQAVQNGERSIKAAYNKMKEKSASRPAEKSFPVTDAQSLPGHIKLLKAAVLLLVDAKETKAAALLAAHFLKKHEKDGFYKLLPENARNALAGEA